MYHKVIIVGNLGRDPEMRYTPDGQPVTTFGVATNRRWTNKEGEQQEAAEFHNFVAWGKLAEICSQLLKKGRRVYVEGRLQTRSWEGKDGVNRQRTEIVVGDMIVLDSRREKDFEAGKATPEPPEIQVEEKDAPKTAKKKTSTKKVKSKEAGDEEISEDEIPF